MRLRSFLYVRACLCGGHIEFGGRRGRDGEGVSGGGEVGEQGKGEEHAGEGGRERSRGSGQAANV